jgi:hypothetical protein
MLTAPVHEQFTPPSGSLDDIDPFPAPRQRERPKDGPGPARAERSLLNDRIERHSAAVAKAWRLRWRHSVKDLAVGAAFLAAWSVVWSLLIFAYQFPLVEADGQESAESSAASLVVPRPTRYQLTTSDGQTQTDDPRYSDDPPLSCSGGTVELEGRCVLGEEIEVGPPSGWRRESNGRASTE